MKNMEDYDVIFLGYPIWWSDMPMAVYTFLESYDFRERQSFRSVPTKEAAFLPPTAALLKSAQVQMFWMD